MSKAIISANDINNMIDDQRDKKWFITDNISDGYHTFWELYEHRTVLLIALCKYIFKNHRCYPDPRIYILRSKKHFDWSEYEWWFIVQLYTPHTWQISYHLPNKYWHKCFFMRTVENAYESDWHTSDDVIRRLLAL